MYSIFNNSVIGESRPPFPARNIVRNIVGTQNRFMMGVIQDSIKINEQRPLCGTRNRFKVREYLGFKFGLELGLQFATGC
jgi:hypothetical protein